MDMKALKKKLTKSNITFEDLSTEIEEIKTEANVARLWRNDPANPINIAKMAEAGVGTDPVAIAAAAAAGTAVPGTESAGKVPSSETGNGTDGAPTAVVGNDDGEEPDEFEIQEDEIMQFKSAQENESMKKEYEKKIEVLNSKLRFAELELEKVTI